jgi:hypothetical protein
MSPVPQGTAELNAHIFQPSLRDCFDFGPIVYPGLTSWATFTPSLRDSEVVSGKLRARQKSKHRAQGEEPQVRFAPQQFNRNNLLFVCPIAPQWNQPITSSKTRVSR